MHHDPDTTLAFLHSLMAPAGSVLELRIFRASFARGGFISPSNYAKTLAGWYDNAQSLMVDAGRLRGVSGYITFNPVNPDLLARSYNGLMKATHTTKDEDIQCLRWLYVDIDPVRPAEISSTDAELAAALGRRDQILSENPGIAACSLWGCSGNGGYLFVRLPDYPNDAEHRAVIAQALAILSSRYSDTAVKVDVSTKNPSRVACLPGTVKCKGSNRPERSWRLVTLDTPAEGREPAPFPLVEWVAEHEESLPSEAAGGSRTPQSAGALGASAGASVAVLAPAGGGIDVFGERIRRAARYVDALPPAVSGQGGHDQTFDAACALVKGFDLRPHDARPILEVWNARCVPPWTSVELDHKLTDADERPDDKPRGYLFDAPREECPARRGSNGTPATPPGPPGPPGGGRHDGEDDDGPCLPGHEDNPHRLARHFLRKVHNHPQGLTLRFWQDEFYTWTAGAYHFLSEKEIRANLAAYIEKDFERIYYNQLIAAAMSEDEKKAPRPIAVTTNLVGHVKQALSGVSLLEAVKHPDQPCWLDGENLWPVSEILPMRNAVVHLPSYLDGLHCTRKPTPRLFCPYVLDYDWSPEAAAPERWLAFLGQLWPDDPESIETLQEWMGLQLVPDTSYQKIMGFIGPPRCGKGTIARVMQAMVGPENVAGPTLSSLGLPFGLESLIGKLSAIIDDARLSGKSDHAVIAERLLSISGEGRLTIGRKYRSDWIGTLPSRITLISNELPRLADNSGALPNRFIVLKFSRSFLGKEDSMLTSTLLKELPGILLWAIEGWRRLRARGFLQQPESGAEIHQEMEELSSPIGTFVADCLNVGPDESEPVANLYLAWKQWCADNSRREPGDQSLFGRNLRSVLPELHTSQARDGGRRVRMFHGVSLKPPESLLGPPAEAGSLGGWSDDNGVPF